MILKETCKVICASLRYKQKKRASIYFFFEIFSIYMKTMKLNNQYGRVHLITPSKCRNSFL